MLASKEGDAAGFEKAINLYNKANLFNFFQSLSTPIQ